MIYVNGRPFTQCMYLLLNLSVPRFREYDKIRSIDEAAELLDQSMHGRAGLRYDITPETEFWGHCSNIQAWAENNYNTCILHRNLAFPLLKRLAEVGDIKARKVYKEEVAVRFSSGHPTVMLFLLNGGYLNALNREEINTLMEGLDMDTFKEQKLDMLLHILQQIERLGYVKGKDIIKNQIRYRFEHGVAQDINFFIHKRGYYLYRRYFRYFTPEEITELFNKIDIEQLKEQNIQQSFPVLKHLAQVGNQKANEIIKEKIIQGFQESTIDKIRYMIKNKFLDNLEPSFLERLFNPSIIKLLLNPFERNSFYCLRYLPEFIISNEFYFEFLKTALSANFYVYKTQALVHLINYFFDRGSKIIERILTEYKPKIKLPVIKALINHGTEKSDDLLKLIDWSRRWNADRIFLSLDNKRITAERAHDILIENNFKEISKRGSYSIYEYSSYSAFQDLSNIMDNFNQNEVVQFDPLELALARDARLILPALPLFDLSLGSYKKFSITLFHTSYRTEINFNNESIRRRYYYYRSGSTKNLREVLNKKNALAEEALTHKPNIIQDFYSELIIFKKRLEKYYHDCKILKEGINHYLTSTPELLRIKALKFKYQEKEVENFRKVYPSTFKPTYNQDTNTLILYEAHKWGKFHADSNIKIHESGIVMIFVNTFVNYSKNYNFHNSQIYFFFPKLKRFYTRKANIVKNFRHINNWDISITNLFGYDFLKRKNVYEKEFLDMYTSNQLSSLEKVTKQES